MRAAFSIAGISALIFGAIFFFFLVSSILLVGGDGTAPGVTHFAGAIMEFSTKVLGTAEISGVVSAVWLFSSIVFAVVFVGALAYRVATPAANNNRVNGYGGHVFLAAFVVGLLILHNDTTQANDQAKEQEMVLGVVRADPGVIHKVGVIDLIHVAMWTSGGRYQVYVRGKRDETFHELYAVVEVSETSGKTSYTVRCTNSESVFFRRDENPCKGNAK